MPEVFLYKRGKFTDDDHCYHEFDELTSTNKAVNDRQVRSIQEFLDEVAAEARNGWQTLELSDNGDSLLGFIS